MKPGHQRLMFAFPQTNGSYNYYASKMIVKKREEDPPTISREIKQKKVERMFEKVNSVFKDWKEDTEQTLVDTIDHDLRLWKCARFIKQEEDLAALEDLVKQKASLLKNLFI
jgi:hypothetical protein